MSASQHAWHAAGRPDHGYASSDAGGPCATCAAPLASGAVALSEIETPTTANHADLFRFGARQVPFVGPNWCIPLPPGGIFLRRAQE